MDYKITYIFLTCQEIEEQNNAVKTFVCPSFLVIAPVEAQHHFACRNLVKFTRSMALANLEC